jgi:hypothetical protein
MPYDIGQWPADAVYPTEVDRECPEAREIIDALLFAMRRAGPSPPGYAVKTLGAKQAGLWQINLKVQTRQVPLLYAPYGHTIVLFRIHKKSSPQEQNRAYGPARRRKADYDSARSATYHGTSAVH